MPTKKPNSTDFISNPLTKRPIRVGGRVYTRLQKQGYFQEGYADKEILDDLGGETENIKIMKKKIEELNQELPKNLQAVKGRGKYKNKIVKRYRKFPKKEIVASISEERAQARQLMKLLQSLPEDGDMETQLTDLLSGNQIQEQEEEYGEEAIELESDSSNDEYEYEEY